MPTKTLVSVVTCDQVIHLIWAKKSHKKPTVYLMYSYTLEGKAGLISLFTSNHQGRSQTFGDARGYYFGW